MTNVFNAYAAYYDLLYKDKDYLSEAEYVASYIKKLNPKTKYILELGCGTGAHAECLAGMGYYVHGIDMSQEMLEKAEQRKAHLPPDVASRLSFSKGDVRTLRLDKIFDTVISLFHVMSYQPHNDDVENMLETASMHLERNGLFLFDFWYGPAVLTQKPETRVKRLENTDIKITRIAESLLRENENLVDVNYSIFIENRLLTTVDHIKERHCMRYFFIPEFEYFCKNNSWNNLSAYEWMSDAKPSLNSWAAFITIAKA